MGWVICLSGEREDLCELSKSFKTDELTIREQNNTYYLESNRIDVSNIYYENTDGSKLVFASATISSSLCLRRKGQAHVVQADGTIVN